MSPISTLLVVAMHLGLGPSPSLEARALEPQSGGAPEAASGAAKEEPASGIPADLAPPEVGPQAPSARPPQPEGVRGPVEVSFLGLWVGPEEAEIGFSVEDRVREGLQKEPFVLVDGPSAPMPPACAAELECRRKKLARVPAPWTVTGHLAVVDGQHQLRLVLFETETGRREASASVLDALDDDGKARLLESVGPVVSAVLQTVDPGAHPVDDEDLPALFGAEADSDELTQSPASAEDAEGTGDEDASGDEDDLLAEVDDDELFDEVDGDDGEEGEGGTNWGAWIWSTGFLASGAGLALGGIAFDLLSPTSVDDQLDLIDAVGPALVVTGAVVAIVGLVANPFLWWAVASDDDDD